MVKTAAQHIESLRDCREVYFDGKRVDDVTRHPAFRNAVRSVAGLYDLNADPNRGEQLTFASPTSGAQVSRCWQLPRSYGELVQRRQGLAGWAEHTNGMMGRSPDHVASSLAGMMMGIDVFRKHDPKRASALADYYAYARDNDLYLSYVITNPQADRSKSASEQADEYLTAGICDEDAAGITIKGAKMLGTGAIMSNEIMVSGFQQLQAGEEKYAFLACVPINAKGLKLFSRRSYEAAALSSFDNPLSSRFDENDAVAYFDEVKIPWDRVFFHRDIAMGQAQWHETRAHVMQNHQCLVRFVVKLRFLNGIARKIAEINGTINFPQIRETLGLLAAKATSMEAMLHGMEAAGERYAGYFVPDRGMVAASQVVSQQLYPEFLDHIRQLAGGGMIMSPSSARDFTHPEIARVIGLTQRSPSASAQERVKFFKLAWDAVGSEFGSRHLQYEMFYSGPNFVTRGHCYRFYDWGRAKAMIEDFMATYELPAAAAGSDRSAAE
jgi:4-hydroxyphenylacetate 3-monooxygenase